MYPTNLPYMSRVGKNGLTHFENINTVVDLVADEFKDLHIPYSKPGKSLSANLTKEHRDKWEEIVDRIRFHPRMCRPGFEPLGRGATVWKLETSSLTAPEGIIAKYNAMYRVGWIDLETKQDLITIAMIKSFCLELRRAEK